MPVFPFAEDSCPYTFDGFVSQVREYCGNPGNIDFCIDLARNCGEMGKNGKPGLTHFASEFLMEMQSEDIEEFRRTGDVCKIKLPSSVLMTRDGTKVLQGFNNTNMACLSAAGCDIEYLPLEKTPVFWAMRKTTEKPPKKNLLAC